MSYAKRWPAGFNDTGPSGGTPADSQFLNAVEAALLALFDTNPASAGMVPVWTPGGTHYVPQLITNASIDPAAAIAKSKLAALAIADADVAGGAAISRSKLNFGSGLVDADIAAAAAIAITKLANIADVASVLRGDGTWVKGMSAIGEIALGSTGVIDFTAIPATYKHLLAIGSVRGSSAVLAIDLDVRWNALSAANYVQQSLWGTFAAAAGAYVSTGTYFATQGDTIYAGSSTAGLFSPVIAFIPNYSTNKFQHMFLFSGNLNTPRFELLCCSYFAAQITINELTFSQGALNQLATGSRMTLYGLG